MRQDIHPSNLTLIDGAVFEGAYEGLLRRGTAAEWIRRWAHNRRAQIAAPPATARRAHATAPPTARSGISAAPTDPGARTPASPTGFARRGFGS